jgi:maltooligosyltrehalose trehalohydrolase
MTRHWQMERGATVLPDGGVRFSIWAPNQDALALRIAGADDVPMARADGGLFEVTVPGAAPGTRYQVVLANGAARPDPLSRSQPDGVHGASEVVDPRAHRWRDGAWRGVEMADLVIYELHVGTFTPEGTFDAIVPRLGELRELGVTAIEIMPVAEFPGARNWGYDGVHLYAVQSSYGGPEGLRRLVDAAHAAGIAVVLDVVYNHVGPEGNYLAEFGPYFTDRYRTPWGVAVNYDGAGSDEVRRFVVDNAVHWIEEYHVDALRLDAVHAIFDGSPTHILQEIAEAVHAAGERLGRRTLVIAESDLNDPRLVRDRDACGYGLDGQWSDDFHHAVHVALTGERSGYYMDYHGVEAVARAIRDRFVYAGDYSPHRGRRHGAPCHDVPGDRFVICLQNHDQVGNRATGDRLATQLSPAQARLAAALLLLSPYVPLLFMGQEYGEDNPFQYFVSHGDEQLVLAVREGRRSEFAAFAWEGEVPDPAAEATFARSRVEPGKAAAGAHRALRALYGDLLRLRREQPALRPGVARMEVTCDEGAEWVALRLSPPRGGRLLALFNLSGGARTLPLPDAGWRGALATEDAEYGGSGDIFRRGDGTVTIAAHAAELYVREDLD